MNYLKIGRVVITTTNQGHGAPFMDQCTTICRNALTNQETFRARGVAFLLAPWRRNRYGESLPQKALVLAKVV